MPLIEWSDRFEIGIARIDVEHRRLVDMLNKLHDAMSQGEGTKVVGEVLTDLLAYTQTHFRTEENLFERYSYPESLHHKLQHQALIQRTLHWKEQFELGNSALSMEVVRSLKDWLVHHIEGSDKAYGPFLIQRGVR